MAAGWKRDPHTASPFPMRLSALLLVLAIGAALPLTGCDSTGIDGPSAPPCSGGCTPGTPPGHPGTPPPTTPPPTTPPPTTPPPTTPPPTGPKTFVGLDGRDTFLRTSEDPGALGPAILPLADLGLAVGNVACFQAVGDYGLGGGLLASQNEQPLVIAAFSASDRFAGSDVRIRIQDAVGPDAGLVTPLTAIGDLETDFTQDFDATDACVTVPTGAAFLFLGAWDAFYSDNEFAGDVPFGVRISRD